MTPKSLQKFNPIFLAARAVQKSHSGLALVKATGMCHPKRRSQKQTESIIYQEKDRFEKNLLK